MSFPKASSTVRVRAEQALTSSFFPLTDLVHWESYEWTALDEAY